jgi:hypothetical protein
MPRLIKGKAGNSNDTYKQYLNKKGSNVTFSDGEKQLRNKRGVNVTYNPIFSNGKKQVINKKGVNTSFFDAKILINQKGKTTRDLKSGSTEYKSFKKGITYKKDSSGKVTSNAPTKKPTAPAAKPTPTKAPAKTVSQVWKEKTGKDWSEAKKLGLSDGSASSNMALLKKLNSGSISKSSLKNTNYRDGFVKTMEKNIADEESGKIAYAAPSESDKQVMRRGGVKGKLVLKKKIVKKPVMRRGGIKKK